MGHAHPHYYHYGHRCRGRFGGKLIFLGVSLWLTSTVIAGVRRATGWTHNAHNRLPPPPEELSRREERRQELRRMIDERLHETREFANERLRQLEQQYGDRIADEATREQWKRTFAAEQERLAEYWAHSNQWLAMNIEKAQETDGHKRHCHRSGGFVNWYLGVGERTFDWFTRKLSRSRHFHWEDPSTPYDALRARQQSDSTAGMPFPPSFGHGHPFSTSAAPIAPTAPTASTQPTNPYIATAAPLNNSNEKAN
ncbi:hypothetical protein GGI12_004729 [Dipsacomyces acuminosporus]|nr:hypothetical protein GGI12_004729 [Dipsacomyces acuminosporus]